MLEKRIKSEGRGGGESAVVEESKVQIGEQHDLEMTGEEMENSAIIGIVTHLYQTTHTHTLTHTHTNTHQTHYHTPTHKHK